jgi:3-hydroxybutyryl-CoA dehydrogenase
VRATEGKVVVAGAGIMGTGIAHAFAGAGRETVLVDPDRGQRERALAQVAELLEAGVARGKVEAGAAEAARARLTATEALTPACDGATLFVETATERLEVKLSLMEAAGAALSQGALIATNTSALSVTEIAAAAPDPARVVGMHFFNPVHKMKLVELIRGLETSDEAVSEAQEIATALGKTFITVNEAPGFTTSRMSALMGNEAMCMLAEGVASAEDIDTAMRMAFNHPMGPLELGDLTGWDTRLKVLRHLHATLGEKFRPNPLIEKLVASGRTGRKVGRGVYAYRDGQRVPGSGIGR